MFRDDGPMVINTPPLNGVFAGLSRSAKRCWPAAVYELAHETVHLLNPTVGQPNWLEEGFAVAFSIEMSGLTPHPMIPPPGSIHLRALDLLRSLPGDHRETARILRRRCTALNVVNVDLLSEVFPAAEPALLVRLAETFPGR